MKRYPPQWPPSRAFGPEIPELLRTLDAFGTILELKGDELLVTSPYPMVRKTVAERHTDLVAWFTGDLELGVRRLIDPDTGKVLRYWLPRQSAHEWEPGTIPPPTDVEVSWVPTPAK